jgi:hypothetical protein
MHNNIIIFGFCTKVEAQQMQSTHAWALPYPCLHKHTIVYSGNRLSGYPTLLGSSWWALINCLPYLIYAAIHQMNSLSRLRDSMIYL